MPDEWGICERLLYLEFKVQKKPRTGRQNGFGFHYYVK
jgi:hypothetical protein